MIKDQWVVWNPVVDVAKKYRLEFCASGSTISFAEETNSKKKLLLKYEADVFSYRKTKLFPNSNIIKQLNDIYGSAFVAEWTFFKVENSSYAQSLSDQSYNFIPVDCLIHFAFITPNELLEIICAIDPEITHINEE